MKLKIMAGTLSIMAMLSTPVLAQAQVASDKSQVLTGQSDIVGLRAKVPSINISPRVTLLAKAKVLGVDIANLTNDQARAKIKSAERSNTLTHLLAQAKTLGIGIDTWQG